MQGKEEGVRGSPDPQGGAKRLFDPAQVQSSMDLNPAGHCQPARATWPLLPCSSAASLTESESVNPPEHDVV